MLATKLNKFTDKHKSLRSLLRKSHFYFFLRDQLFLSEQKREKRIEKKGIDAMKAYCKKWYKKSTGFELNLDNPKTLTEKQQWLKFYDTSSKKNELTDKFKVREFIKKEIGDKYLIPLIGIDGQTCFKNAFQIDFNKLPDSFVLSCNHGSSMTIVVDNKNNLSKYEIKCIKRRLNRWMKINLYYVNAFDFIYKDIDPCVLIFPFLKDSSGELNDYKFTCFNGEIKYFWVDSDRFGEHKRNTYDLEYNEAPFSINHYKKGNPKKVLNLDKMKLIVKKLCKGFKMVRVDLYNVDGKIYFGEMTFNSEAGKGLPNPIDYDEKIGNWLKL